MEVVLPLLLGILSGFAYNEHLYRSAMSFNKDKPKTAFLWRFLILGTIMVPIALYWGERAIVVFLTSHLLVRMAHTLLRGLKVVRL